MPKKLYPGIIGRGHAGSHRYYGVLRWPGVKSPTWHPLGTDYEIAVIKYKELHRKRDEQKRFGVQSWDIFVEKYKTEKICVPKTAEMGQMCLAHYAEVIHPEFLSDLSPRRLLEAQSLWVKKYPGHSLNTLDTWKNTIIVAAHWAEDRDYAPVQNWRIVKNLSKMKNRKGTYTQEEQADLINRYPPFSKECNAFMAASELGLRREEIHHCWLSDLDLSRNIGKVVGRDGWTPKMEGDDRLVYYPITPAFKKYALALIKKRKEAGCDSSYLFADLDGYHPVNVGFLTRLCVRLTHRIAEENAKIGKPGFLVSMHKFRRTYVTRLLNRQESPAVVRNAARHKDMETTEKYDNTGIQLSLQSIKNSVFDYAGTAVEKIVAGK